MNLLLYFISLADQTLQSAAIVVIMTAQTSSDTHARETFCACRMMENPLSDLRLVTTFAATRGNLHLSMEFCSSVH
jgi:hypothetical protein